MSWFPQQYATEFNYVKAVIALVAAVLLIAHMAHIWPHLLSNAQRARYLVLLGYAMITVYGSYSLAHDNRPIELRNLLTLLVTIMLVLVTILSMRDWKRSRRT